MWVLSIESDEDLLKEIGRNVLYNNHVEFSLKNILLFKIDKLQQNLDISKKALKRIKNNSTLGGFINIAKDFSLLSTDKIEMLEILNIERRMLAHGIAGECVLDPLAPKSSGIYTLMNSGKEELLTVEFLKANSNYASKCLTMLMQEFIPYVPSNIAEIYKRFE